MVTLLELAKQSNPQSILPKTTTSSIPTKTAQYYTVSNGVIKPTGETAPYNPIPLNITPPDKDNKSVPISVPVSVNPKSNTSAKDVISTLVFMIFQKIFTHLKKNTNLMSKKKNSLKIGRM